MEKTYPNVSVIIPHLNQHRWIGICLKSIAEQSFPVDNIEVLLVDNGSTHMPEDEVKPFPFTKLLLQEEPGPGPARNLGVSEAKGDYLFFIDADCRAHKDWIKNGIAALNSEGSAPLIGGDVKIDCKDFNALTPLEAYESIFAYRQKEYIKKMGFSGSGNLATRPDAFHKVGPFPGLNVAEDRAWGGVAIQKGLSFDYVAEMLIYHPARESTDEIYQKWDRHTRHDYEDMKLNSLAGIKWFIRTIMVLFSIPVHSMKIITSDRIQGFSHKMGAITMLSKIRWFRVKAMLALLFSKAYREKGVQWNRP
ncbi:glycosyltransferase family 2 protein [Kordiimonas sp. SCSIO 12610]|uniref:glycosyltransferase n=1 Tax=Kordiimonas sp. SCSIO 12610 TaxID=2829597 RepID=UPI00210E791F|nr:glycosyltransferase [Kordiimonas sp. SCSIO 12610]UTW55874.1 glycosyltransferase [Kordiimonas sp. SCSIO 12610]